ncbi:SET domain-containing protein [Oleiagrimonas sp.]|jgi:hypothetical protein|uniref:SET domain-containing protein n=1 Tax=Oleiagrimonas sp. TaxID=2010330 RepID=UPI002616FE4A|nr:SET domain-containing protein [Oleiagrimonas sp.]MDA3914471.1 SET domain-containing protein [Oleiagrimonas sp.]
MILPRYRITSSAIAGAGKGLFIHQHVGAGSIIVAPDAIDRTWSLAEIDGSETLRAQRHACARWFEDRYTLSPDWPDECYVNHSFEPTGLWHLGFIFATADLAAGTEITVDYRHLLPPGEQESFNDAASGEKIAGYTWSQSLSISTRALAALIGT